jgi:hypothetical protein
VVEEIKCFELVNVYNLAFDFITFMKNELLISLGVAVASNVIFGAVFIIYFYFYFYFITDDYTKFYFYFHTSFNYLNSFILLLSLVKFFSVSTFND